ncbi:hypothetical protein [Roseimaritima sediminicola]|uniref:hypothetical protein n=1 Tax=Roseimaritima sediminicola TaxID=2662066 RepID=UPI0012983E4B|nr:hypothetical protein [Roseimaritima sediminicola]
MFCKLQISDVEKTTFPAVEFDPEYDDARSVIASICDGLDEAGTATFIVSGFGDSAWPFDVATDLVTLIEQLPEALTVLELRSGEFRIDFYEQGIERLIFFNCSGDVTELRCQSRTDWEPSPNEMRVRSSELAAMLSAVYRQFMNVAMATPMPDAARKALTEWAVMRNVAA